MEQTFRDRIMPAEWLWCIINNLHLFNEKPEYIQNLIDKFKLIQDHRLLSSFSNIMERIEEYFIKYNKFPDMAWLTVNFKGNSNLRITNDEFSMQIYESIDKYLDQEYIKQELEKRILDKENPNLEDIRDLTKQMVKFTDRVDTIDEETKNSLINSYDEYSADFKGLQTHIPAIDKVIGVMGYKSLSVFAAPSGHGKSTFAMSVAYYAALHGACVDYLSFEVPKMHVWFNLVAMESESTDHKLVSSKMKENLLKDEEKEYYKEHMRSLLQKIKESDGYINVLDQTTASVDSYEGLCAKLETIAEKRGRGADLIVVDNIDNFQILKSSERDEATRINNYIVSLDAFSKKYNNGQGATILLLSQVNRPALKKLDTTNDTNSKDKEKRASKIDVTCVQKYNALYEKATCVLVGYSDEVLRSSDTMMVYPVKLRNRGLPARPISLSVKFAYSKIMGELPINKVKDELKQDAIKQFVEANINNGEGVPNGMSKEEEDALENELFGDDEF